MADKTSLIITADDFTTGKAQQKTVTDINPNALSSHLRTWAQMTASLTKDTYKKAKRIDVTDLDNATDKALRNPIIKYVRSISNNYQDPIVPGDGVINMTTDQVLAQRIRTMVQRKDEFTVPQILNLTDSDADNPVSLEVIQWERGGGDFWYIFMATNPKADITARTVSFTLFIPETDQYQAFYRDITYIITEEEG